LPASEPGLGAGAHDLAETVRAPRAGRQPGGAIAHKGPAPPTVDVVVECGTARRDVIAGRPYVDLGYLNSEACRG